MKIAAILAVSALVGITACDKREAAAKRDPMGKLREEVRQTTRDIGEGVGKGADKVIEESRQTSRDVGEAVKAEWVESKADLMLSRRVRGALETEPGLADHTDDLRISCNNGTVRLTGTVATPAISRDMARVAAQVPGAVKVDNDLRVDEWAGVGSPRN